MKRKLIALCVSSVLVGSGIIFNMNQDVSVPTVEKFTEDTSASVSKHENVDKDEKSIAASTNRKSETKESKNEESSTEKNESQKPSSKQTSTSKSETTTSVSSESKNKIPKKKVLVRVLPVQIKRHQLQTVPMHRVNQTMML